MFHARHFGAEIVLIVGYFSDYVDEVGDLDVCSLFGCFNSKQRWLTINIQECVNQKILSFKDEAPSDDL